MPLIEVTSCQNCPFLQWEGEGTNAGTGHCWLAYTDLPAVADGKVLLYEIEPQGGIYANINTPEWCPLINDEYTVTGKLGK